MKFSRLRLMGWSLAFVALITPLLAMQFTDEVVWTAGDFIAFAILLILAGLALEATVKFVRQSRFRWAIGLAIIAAFFTVWVELAVGIFH